jgi:glycosyltransferase involved in cell wall biosynthesis
MPRIAFIDYFPTHYRRRLYEEIARRADADFYFFSDQRERWWNPNIPLAMGGDFRRIDLPRYRVAGNAVMPQLAGRILRRDYDAVIKSVNGKLMLPLVYGAAKASGTVFVLWSGMWMHPTTRIHRLDKPLIEGIYRGADAIVTYGTHVRQFVLETRGVDPEKVFVAGQAVIPDRFTAVERVGTGDSADVLYVGQFEERKGLAYLLEAFAQIDHPQARLRLIGSGSDEGWLRERIRGDARIELVGQRPQDELPDDLARARCLVLPSITTALDKEPWGLVVNEAFHAGVPVVVSDAVGAAAGGLVRDGENGFVVPERDSRALAVALRRLIDDPVLAARMGDAGREDVRAYNYRRMGDAFLAGVEHGLRARRSRGLARDGGARRRRSSAS